MPNIHAPQSPRELPVVFLKNMIGLATSGFGVVVALAWNEVIRKTVDDYINPYLGKGSGLASMLIYAVIMTFLSVVITMQLSSIERKMDALNQKTATRNTKKRKPTK